MQKVTSAGILLFRAAPEKSFLLLKTKKRWDVPKGHVERGETEIEGALRELREETGITPEQVTLDESFRFETNLNFKAAYLGGRFIDKTYVVFLGYLSVNLDIILTEHDSYQWFFWNPPHYLQKWLIDPLLVEVQRHFDGQE
ncbi:MAG: NUDIX domain-containing protein [Chloroflexota bacterium]